jgi:hypothetical protein
MIPQSKAEQRATLAISIHYKRCASELNAPSEIVYILNDYGNSGSAKNMRTEAKTSGEDSTGSILKKMGCYRGVILLLALGISSHAAAQDELPPPTSYSAAIWNYLTVGSSLTLGIGGREADLTVKRLSDKASGKLVQRNEKSYFLNYSTRPIFFDDSHFGYDFVFNLSTFHMGQQEVAKNTYQDLGTSGRGKFAYVVPTLFYMWGDHRQGTYFKSGVGVGAGIATFDGDIILTDSATQERVTFSHKTTDLRFASSFVFEGRWNNWGFRLIAAGPSLQKDGYEFQLADIALSFGYRFTF